VSLLACAFLVASASAGAVAPPRRERATVLRVTATAYCQKGKTASGVNARSGIIAADPTLLPIGSLVSISQARGYSGVYTVMDTGGAVRGRKIDIFTPSCAGARKFGRHTVQLTVLRLGPE
jgi:3D (Asp-Asp-Asp) domain-containing protein